MILVSLISSLNYFLFFCEIGGIGRRAGLRIQSRKGYGFDSLISHKGTNLFRGTKNVAGRRVPINRDPVRGMGSAKGTPLEDSLISHNKFPRLKRHS
jgi:hypothetical protein